MNISIKKFSAELICANLTLLCLSLKHIPNIDMITSWFTPHKQKVSGS